ncbi:hypothetical protein GCM10009641_72850 [Mycobacterium cookii]
MAPLIAATASRNGTGSAVVVISAAPPRPAPALDGWRASRSRAPSLLVAPHGIVAGGSQRLTLDPSADTRSQARRFAGGAMRRGWLVGGETGLPLLPVGGQAFPYVGPAEAQKLQAK